MVDALASFRIMKETSKNSKPMNEKQRIESKFMKMNGVLQS